MKIVVTGSAGYIGSALVPYLKEQGHHVIGFDITHPVSCPIEDIRKKDAVYEFMKCAKPDAVIHLAAMRDARWCQSHISECYSVNFAATLELASICQELGIKLIYANTYKNSTYTENHYIRSKTLAADILKEYGAVIINLVNVVGGYPGYRPHAQTPSITDAIITSIKRKSDLMLTGNVTRQFVFIKDVLKEFEAALSNPRLDKGGTVDCTGPGIHLDMITWINYFSNRVERPINYVVSGALPYEQLKSDWVEIRYTRGYLDAIVDSYYDYLFSSH